MTPLRKKTKIAEWKKKWKKGSRDFMDGLFIALFFYACVMFYIGFHNFDLGQNMANIECWYDTTLHDKGGNLAGTKDIIFTSTDVYIMGVRQTHRSFLLLSTLFMILFIKRMRGLK